MSFTTKILCGTRNKGKYITIFDDYAEVDLGKNIICKISLEDVENISKRNWCITKLGYAMATRSYLHRYIFNLTDRNIEIDHINKDKLDNRRENLRIVSSSENKWNQRKLTKTKTSKYKGVYFNKNNDTWRSRIRKDGKYIEIGSFKEEKQAGEAYAKKAMELFGEYACWEVK